MFVRVRDIDPNKDPLCAKPMVIAVGGCIARHRDPAVDRDRDPIRPEFVGYVQSTSRANDNYDCVLWVADAVEIVASYFDSEDGTDTAAAAALVDPFGVCSIQRPVAASTVRRFASST